MGLYDLFKGSWVVFSIYGRQSFVQWENNNLLVIFYFWAAEGDRRPPGAWVAWIAKPLLWLPFSSTLIRPELGKWMFRLASFHVNRCPYPQTNLENCVVMKKREAIFFQLGKRRLLIILLNDLFLFRNPGNKSQLFQEAIPDLASWN